MSAEALFLLPGAQRDDPQVQSWFRGGEGPLRLMAQHWFAVMRDGGPDVHEIMHDGCPTACIGQAAFAYVGAFRAHVSIGFFQGATLPDPASLLEGAGKRMRHVKLPAGKTIHEAALRELIHQACLDMRRRVQA